MWDRTCLEHTFGGKQNINDCAEHWNRCQMERAFWILYGGDLRILLRVVVKAVRKRRWKALRHVSLTRIVCVVIFTARICECNWTTPCGVKLCTSKSVWWFSRLGFRLASEVFQGRSIRWFYYSSVTLLWARVCVSIRVPVSVATLSNTNVCIIGE